MLRHSPRCSKRRISVKFWNTQIPRHWRGIENTTSCEISRIGETGGWTMQVQRKDIDCGDSQHFCICFEWRSQKILYFSPFLHQFSLPVGVSEHFWDEKWWPWPKKLWTSYSTWIVGMSRYPVFCLIPLHCKVMTSPENHFFFKKKSDFAVYVG